MIDLRARFEGCMYGMNRELAVPSTWCLLLAHLLALLIHRP
jgi:hypothetical protein